MQVEKNSSHTASPPYSTHTYMGVVVGAWSHTEDQAGCEG